MKPQRILQFVAPILFVAFAPAAFGAEGTTTIGGGIANVVIFVKGIIAFLWNMKLVLGLFICASAMVYWHTQNKKDGDKTILVPLVGLIGGSLLTVSGAIDLGSNLFNLDQTEGTSRLAIETDGRANMVASIEYTAAGLTTNSQPLSEPGAEGEAPGDDDMAEILDP